jgi:hypothetical protein
MLVKEGAAAEMKKEAPHLVFIMADDLGYNDIGYAVGVNLSCAFYSCSLLPRKWSAHTNITDAAPISAPALQIQVWWIQRFPPAYHSDS